MAWLAQDWEPACRALNSSYPRAKFPCHTPPIPAMHAAPNAGLGGEAGDGGACPAGMTFGSYACDTARLARP
jgi:hypothetical protein